MLKTTHLNHPNRLPPLDLIGLRLVIQVHGQILKNTMKIMQEKLANLTYTP
jgi:hypothetical protein